jgi:hypothetical protein
VQPLVVIILFCHLFFFVIAEAILLGFQHFLVMLGTTVLIPTALVPQMGGDNVILQFNPLFWHVRALYILFLVTILLI